jgi:hypothetical protein
LRHNLSVVNEPDALDAISQVSPRMLCHLARIYDEWDGEDYEGSSCRGAMRGWHRHGVCELSLWPYFDDAGVARFVSPRGHWVEDATTRPLGAYYRINKDSINDMQAAIHEVGAIYCSGEVHTGWDLDPSENLPQIEVRKKITGGHSSALVGYNDAGFIVQNSWGTDWGFGGFAVRAYPDWAKTGMDAWVAVLGAPVRLTSFGATRRRVSLYDIAANDRAGDLEPGRAVVASVRGAPTPLQEAAALQHALVLSNDGRPLKRLHANHPGLEIHLAGHPAGSIVLGHLLSGLGDVGLSVPSTTLFAPACTCRFALDHYGEAYANGLLPQQSIFIESMDDERERADSVGPYGKSLLDLVSRAFEDIHKTPLLGLAIATEGNPKRDGSYWHDDVRDDITDVRRFIKQAEINIRLHTRDRQRVSDGVNEIELAHGSFDNDIEVIGRTLHRIRGEKLKQDVLALHGF